MSNSPRPHRAPRSRAGQTPPPSSAPPLGGPPPAGTPVPAGFIEIAQMIQAQNNLIMQLPAQIAAASRPPCALCVMERHDWAGDNQAAIATAQEQLQAAAQEWQEQHAGTPGPETPAPPSLAQFLPPGMPPLFQSATEVGGTWLCEQHLGVNSRMTRPERQQRAAAMQATQPGAQQPRPLLLAHVSDVHAAAREALAFGMPRQ